MTVIDLIALAIVALSCLLGLMRGFVREAVSLSGWLLAFYAAKTLSPSLADSLPGIDNPSLRYAVALVLVFVTVLLLASIVSIVLRGIVKQAGLAAHDKAVGLLFGIARALLVLVSLTIVAGLTALPKTVAWQESWSHGWLESAAGKIGPWLPQDLAALVQFH